MSEQLTFSILFTDSERRELARVLGMFVEKLTNAKPLLDSSDCVAKASSGHPQAQIFRLAIRVLAEREKVSA